MRVVYFGTPAFACPTLAALLVSPHRVVAAVTQPDRARGRGQHVTFSPVKELAVGAGVPVLQPTKLGTDDFLEALRETGADVGVVAAYGRILPQTVLDAFPRGMVNVHASLLPRWRGAAPIHRSIQAGDAVTGVTIMRVVLALDAGPMLARTEVAIGPDIRSDQLEQELAVAGARLLVETLDRMERGTVEERPQDESRVTYAHRLDRKDGVVDWTRPAIDIHNQIRGLHPWPLASVMFKGKRLILRASSVPETSFPQGAPGTIIALASEGLVVGTGTTPLVVTDVQLEGRRPQSARDFANAAHPSAGDRLEPVAL